MSPTFVWFDNIGPARDATADFLAKTFDGETSDIGSMTFITSMEKRPFAAACDPFDGMSGWVPYIEVDDLDNATASAIKNGATLVAANMDGPAGVATFVKDPGGAPMALWKRGPGM